MFFFVRLIDECAKVWRIMFILYKKFRDQYDKGRYQIIITRHCLIANCPCYMIMISSVLTDRKFLERWESSNA